MKTSLYSQQDLLSPAEAKKILYKGSIILRQAREAGNLSGVAVVEASTQEIYYGPYSKKIIAQAAHLCAETHNYRKSMKQKIEAREDFDTTR